MIKSFRYRLYPNREQTLKLNRTLDICRNLYNAALEQRRTAWRGCKSVNISQQMAELPDLKHELPEVSNVHSQVLQDVLWRADTSFKNFFRRVKQHAKQKGYPRFKSRNRYDSFCYPQSGFSIAQGRLCLSKIGNLKIKLHRPIEGEIKTCTIKRDVDQWYVTFACEIPNPQAVLPFEQVGLDVGIESFVATSDGEFIENPRLFVTSQKKLRRLQRSLSRKKLRGANRNKARILVAKQHRKVRRQRLGFHHKVSRQLVNKYDLMAIEDLQVANIVKNHCLAKHISDVGWSQFASILTFKAEEAGKSVVRVNPAYTSQACSGCGCLVSKELSERWHSCPDCGLELHRDVNAAKNILSSARALPLGVKLCKTLARVPGLA